MNLRLGGENFDKPLRSAGNAPIYAPPNFARACGRVLVGGHPDKKADSRQGHKGFALGDWISRGKDPGSQDPRPEQRPAAGGETGEPRSPRGTQLKATTERAFLVSSALQRSTPKRLVHLARRAVGVSPSKQRQLLGRRARRRRSCLHRTAGAMTLPR